MRHRLHLAWLFGAHVRECNCKEDLTPTQYLCASFYLNQQNLNFRNRVFYIYEYSSALSGPQRGHRFPVTATEKAANEQP